MLNLPYAWFDLLRMMWPFGLGCLCRGRGGEGAGLAEKSISEASSTRAPSLSRMPSYRSRRHVLVEEEQSDKKSLHDGRSLLDTYLTREAELDSQTLPARALVAQQATPTPELSPSPSPSPSPNPSPSPSPNPNPSPDPDQSLDEARRASSLFFCEARTGFEKLQTVARAGLGLPG